MSKGELLATALWLGKFGWHGYYTHNFLCFCWGLRWTKIGNLDLRDCTTDQARAVQEYINLDEQSKKRKI